MDVTPLIDQLLVNMLRNSLRLQDPLIVTDPVYRYTDEELWEVLQLVAPKFDPDETIDSVDEKYYPVILVLARIEVFWRLATHTAPYYKLEAEGASLEKNQRFEHYFKLVGRAQTEYRDLLVNLGGAGKVDVQDVTVKTKHNSNYNYEHSITPVVSLTLSAITSNSVNLDWSRFNTKNGVFGGYKLYISQTPIYDPYAEIRFLKDATYLEYDVNRTKHRFINLLPNTLYYVLVVTRDINGIFGYAEETFTTLSS